MINKMKSDRSNWNINDSDRVIHIWKDPKHQKLIYSLNSPKSMKLLDTTFDEWELFSQQFNNYEENLHCNPLLLYNPTISEYICAYNKSTLYSKSNHINPADNS